MKRCVLLLALMAPAAYAIGQARYILDRPSAGAFPIVQSKTATPILIDPTDWPGVARAAADLQADIERVTAIKPSLVTYVKDRAIVIGTIGRDHVIDALIAQKKLDVSGVAGKWEAFVIQTVNTAGGLALVIAGSDKRGTIYGIYDLCEQIGVSPWYFWADVPTVHRDALYVKPGRYMEGEPAVKYRGIFLNDEAPALSGWVAEKYGMAKLPGVVNMGHEFYAKVFELILRLKGNYLWPAMWNNAFNEDDPENPRVADEYGIVMGNSHHEPMLRAQKEWTRHGTGPWDYSKNADVLKTFWTEGVHRNSAFESIVSIGMRGDGDMPMAGTSLEANVKLLEQIVADQRRILAEQVNPDVTKIPQLWALYKEVQGYYEKGMRVPDDVTLLWCDDNWGNIRRLPTPDERKRSGGAGIYYHFDYVGGPRNYKWIDTNPIPKIWEQMNLALNYGADRIWIVNVGDLKPMEFPTDFFLSFARNPQRWPKEKLGDFTRLWAEREFGPAYAAEIADLVATYLKYAGRRKPELLEPTTFSLTNYHEADRIVDEFHTLIARAERLQAQLPAASRDAFFELVLHPAKAYGQVAEMYVAAGRNHLYAEQGRAAANDEAARVKALFQADIDLGNYYNHTLANGKWDHMMDQTHIGYTYWQQPPNNTMPAVKEIELPAAAAMGVDAEPLSFGTGQRRSIDIYNKGKAPFEFTARASAPWIVLSATKGTVEKQQRLWVSVTQTHGLRGTIQVSGPGSEVTLDVTATDPPADLHGFLESDGYVSIEAEHYSKATPVTAARWEKIDDFGRTLSAMSVFPVTADSVTAGPAAPSLEYRMYLFHSGKAEINAILGPTQNFVPGRGLRFAMAFDDQPPQIIDTLEHNTNRDWETTVKDSVRYVKSTFQLASPGYHTLKIWMVDPGLVLEKLIVDLGGLKPSYLGPPESFRQ
jgi:Glycosyl hydrolase family 115/Gylcosyl hydrolase family 115 C-terminal domain/Glycosyl hydrolase family 67 N-terminus